MSVRLNGLADKCELATGYHLPFLFSFFRRVVGQPGIRAGGVLPDSLLLLHVKFHAGP